MEEGDNPVLVPNVVDRVDAILLVEGDIPMLVYNVDAKERSSQHISQCRDSTAGTYLESLAWLTQMLK